MKLVDVEEVHEIFNWANQKPPYSKKTIHRYIDMAREVDAVPVIRCKDCKYWQLEHYVGGQGMSCQMDNSDDVCLTEPTHFCAWAERREE